MAESFNAPNILEEIDPAILYLDNLIKISSRSIRIQQLRVRILIVLATALYLLGLLLLGLYLGSVVESDAGKVMLQFAAAPSGGGGILTSALAVFPYKEILPLQIKIERYSYLKRSYLSAAAAPEAERRERQRKVIELIDTTT